MFLITKSISSKFQLTVVQCEC